MPYSFVTSSATNRHPFNQTTLTTPASFTVQAGDAFIIEWLSGSLDTGPFTITDSASTSNVYTQITAVNNLRMAYCLSAAAGTYTITVSGGTHIQNLVAKQYRGISAFQNSTFTQQNGPGNGANVANSGNAACTAQPAMIYGVSVDGNQVGADPPTFTPLAAGTSPIAFTDRGGFWQNLSTFFTSWFEDTRVTATGNYASTFGTNASSSGDTFYTGVLVFTELPSASLPQSPVWFDPHATVGSVNRTYGSAVTPGSCLVCCVAAPQGGKTWTVSDTVNGAWPAAVYTASGLTTQSIQVFAFPNTAAGTPSVTATQTSGTNGMQITIYEVAGINGVIDQSASNHGASANATSVGPTGALAAGGEFVVCVAELNAGSAGWAPGGAYNMVSSGSTANGSSYYITGNTTVAQSPSFTWTTSEAWGTVVVAFQLGSGPAPTPYMPYSSTQFIVQDRVIVS